MAIYVPDVYTWRVTYQDGSSLHEFDAVNTIGRGFAEVDSAKVKELKLASQNLTHSVEVPAGAEPVFFRRRRVAINLTDESTTPQPTVHCIGWKRGDEAVYLFVFDDGSTLLSDNLQAV